MQIQQSSKTSLQSTIKFKAKHFGRLKDTRKNIRLSLTYVKTLKVLSLKCTVGL